MSHAAWWDVTVEESDHCLGWHHCLLEADHQGDCRCAGGHTCPPDPVAVQPALDFDAPPAPPRFEDVPFNVGEDSP